MNMAATFSKEITGLNRSPLSIWHHPSGEKRPQMICFAAALLFHAIVFFIGGAILF